MSVSASRRTWEEASSPAAIRLAREYEQAWRNSHDLSRRPDLQGFINTAGPSTDGDGARLALLRADLSLRWEAGEKVGARDYLDRHPGLSEETVVALIYEEFCLREEDGEHPDPAQFLGRFPEVAVLLRRVLDIHGLVGSGSARGGSLLGVNGSDDHACAFPEAGQTISGFFLVEELGRGAFARVFLARERELADRPVALKVTRRGSREPQTLARLQHTHIVPVHSHRIDRATGLHLLCMPYFGRTTLARVLAEARERGIRSGDGLVDTLDRLEQPDGPAGLSSGRAALESRSYDRAIAWWGSRLAEALEHAHERGVLHRDIKPSNVLVTSDGMPMLLDFNLAREPFAKDGDGDDTVPGGTVDYMAPEHLRALADGDPEGVDHRSDIYSLGVVLYEALTGRRPFAAPRRGASLVEALQRAADDRTGSRLDPRSVERQVPPALAAVVRRCLEPGPADRYRAAGELAADLRAVADDLPLAFAREPMASQAGGWLRRKRRKLALAAVLLFATVLGLVISLGYLMIRADEAKFAASQVLKASEANDNGEYETARIFYNTVTDATDHFDKLDLRNDPPPGRGVTGTLRAIVDRLWALRDVPDLDDLRATARDKGQLAGRYARVYADADRLHRDADRLRFDLLLKLKDLPTVWPELQQALDKPFYVLTSPDWTKLEFGFRMLDESRGRPLKNEVNELLFLWVKRIDDVLSKDEAAAIDPEHRAKQQEIVRSTLEICDHALHFAEPRDPWLALRARLMQTREEAATGRRRRAEPVVGREPLDIASERSALASFEWALLSFRQDQMGRSTDWMRHAVRLRGDDYWYQFFLAYILDVAGHADEAVEHYSTAAALQPDSPWVRFSRARLYRSKGNWRGAFQDFDVALKGLSDRPEARRVLLERGVLYHQTMGDFVRARADYDAVTRGDAGDVYGRAARLNRANLDADSGRFEPARAEYDALLVDDVTDTAVRHSRAILELRCGQPALADHDLSALLSMRDTRAKDHVEFLAERAQARLLLGRAADAVADAENARRIHRCPAHDRLVQRALLAARRYDRLQLDRPEEVALLPLRGARLDAELRVAASDLERMAVGQGGAAYRACLTRAVILAALGDWRTALASVDRAASLSRFSVEVSLLRARILAAAGDRLAAAADVERSLRIHPDDPGLLELRGTLRLAGGDPQGALADFNLAMSPGAGEGVHIGRATALLALGHDRMSLEEWSLALRRDPELPEAFLGRARTYFLLREWDLGLADLEQAAAWAHADLRIETAVALSYLQCLPRRPDRLPRLLVHLRRAAGGLWHSLDARSHLAAGPN